LVWHPSQSDGMESRRRREWHHASACIPVGLIPYATSSQFHTATSCGFHATLRVDYMHAFGVIWIRKEKRCGKEFIA